MKICIVGPGLLGGSFGLAIQRQSEDHHIIGVDIDQGHVQTALDKGIIHEAAKLEDAIPVADLVVLATPVDTIAEQVYDCLDLIRTDAVVIDMGSTKSLICQQVDKHPLRGRFVASHPIAGTENSGPSAAFAELFHGKMMIICDREKSDEDALKTVEDLYNGLSMKIEYMPSLAHDIHIAYVSHLSHISSFALGATVLDKEKNEQNIFIMAGSGFDSTVRLAKSSPDMWSPIFSHNRQNISEALGVYIEKLKSFKELIDLDDREGTHRFMKETNDIRRVLKDPKG